MGGRDTVASGGSSEKTFSVGGSRTNVLPGGGVERVRWGESFVPRGESYHDILPPADHGFVRVGYEVVGRHVGSRLFVLWRVVDHEVLGETTLTPKKLTTGIRVPKEMAGMFPRIS